MDEVVPMKIRQQRSKMLRMLSEKKRRKFYEENLGNTATVLFEEDVENGYMHGFTENYVRVSAPYDPLLINELQVVSLQEINEQGSVTIESADMLVS